MAELTDGINGPIKGRAGNLVFYMVNGKTFVRSRPKKRGKKRTVKEKVNTGGFALVQKWMQPIGDFIKYGFKDYGISKVGYKSAVSYALSNGAVQGTYPHQFVDPLLVRVTGGELQVPVTASAVLEEGNLVRFTWDKGDLKSRNINDQAMLLVYSPPISGNYEPTVEYNISGAFRKDGTDTLKVSPRLYDQEFHIYLGFVNWDRTQQSHSLYLGSIFMPGLPQDELFAVYAASKESKANAEEAKTPIEDKTLNIARNLRNMGLTDADIATATGLSMVEIERLI